MVHSNKHVDGLAAAAGPTTKRNKGRGIVGPLVALCCATAASQSGRTIVRIRVESAGNEYCDGTASRLGVETIRDNIVCRFLLYWGALAARTGSTPLRGLPDFQMWADAQWAQQPHLLPATIPAPNHEAVPGLGRKHIVFETDKKAPI